MARPSSYDPKWLPLLPELFSQGESVAEVCCVMGIPSRRFYTWCDSHPEFGEAYRDAKDTQSKAWWMKTGRDMASGKIKGNPSVWVMNVRNKFGWADVPTNRLESIGKIEFEIVDKTSKK